MRRLLLLLIVGLFLASCGGSTTDTAAGDADATDTAQPDMAASAPAASDGASAPESAAAPFGTVTTVDGATLDGAQYAGDSLALWFWAPW